MFIAWKVFGVIFFLGSTCLTIVPKMLFYAQTVFFIQSHVGQNV